MIQKYKNINSKNYDFLWSVGGTSYFFTSIWLHPEFTKRDFVVCNVKEDHKLYISKKNRKILSLQGLNLIAKDFKSYEDKIKKSTQFTIKLFREIKKGILLIFIIVVENQLQVFSEMSKTTRHRRVACLEPS